MIVYICLYDNISPSTFCILTELSSLGLHLHHLIAQNSFLSDQQVIETLLFSTFVSWKAFFPLVRDDTNCTYTFITGTSLIVLQHIYLVMVI